MKIPAENLSTSLIEAVQQSLGSQVETCGL